MIGHIDRVTTDIISGWANSAYDSDPDIVHLYINGKKAAETNTDILRPGLIEKNISKTGICGFRFDIGALQIPLDEATRFSVKIKVQGKWTDIGNSPYTFEPEGWLEKMQNKFERGNGDKILLVGLPKSGTSALTYTVAEKFQNPIVHFEPMQANGLFNPSFHYEQCIKPRVVVTKSLFFNYYKDGLNSISSFYNKRIWIVRDPRDWLVSNFLYHWYKGHNIPQDQFDHAYEKVLEKEASPKNLSFYSLLATTRDPEWYFKRLEDALKQLREVQLSDSDWFILRYEDLVDNNLERLSEYIGRDLKTVDKLPKNISRVVRRKQYGNWKNWFTSEDIDLFSDHLSPFLEYFNYSLDMTPNENPEIDPKYSSKYMKSIASKI